MKKNNPNSSIQLETDPFLKRAYKLLANYAKAMGTICCVLDKKLEIITESRTEISVEKNICLYCAQYMDPEKCPEKLHPCNELHSNAVRESYRYGGTYIYMCDLGFLFWTSPLYTEGEFQGAFLSTGFLGIDKKEVAALMFRMGKGAVPEPEIKKRLSNFSKGDSKTIQSLAEILLICAESLSPNGSEYYKALRRKAEQQSGISLKIEAIKNSFKADETTPNYPLDEERLLLSYMRKGDMKNARDMLNKLLAILLLLSGPGQFKIMQLRAIELIALLSRTVISPGYDPEALLRTNNYFYRCIEDSKTIEDVADILHLAAAHFAWRNYSYQGIYHGTSLKKAEHFIWDNYTRKISLSEIANASGLSPPYFSTIFKEEMGENLSCYINRMRVEKAEELLLKTDYPLSKIAGDCGFEDQSWFSKIFKNYAGMSPGRFRTKGGMKLPETQEINFSTYYNEIIKK
ncbi:helix-turn-helix domain-containing protein [Leadbettera azotonutricia]|uniref:Transcriptional regulator, AraC family n=1 Tax=Leadbettera azotonutricia (strain ATCC BAA-888 / DSM 13862 / ZAS-9) TaxID=545695 RepID=F5YE02_LEAAZ|nr:helix-turn-helix domain-containing protein [Leadbettera azotonutricia]AEF81697.1 transcriptional regulator, AraC family [Leadbettera azotonutricia ZAS-9]